MKLLRSVLLSVGIAATVNVNQDNKRFFVNDPPAQQGDIPFESSAPVSYSESATDGGIKSKYYDDDKHYDDVFSTTTEYTTTTDSKHLAANDKFNADNTTEILLVELAGFSGSGDEYPTFELPTTNAPNQVPKIEQQKKVDEVPPVTDEIDILYPDIPLPYEKKTAISDTPTTPPPPYVPGLLMETPDVLIAIDMQTANADNWPKTKTFVKDAVETLAEYFKIGGCLDELRIGVFQYGNDANHVVSLGDFNKYMGSRDSCFNGQTDFIQLQNDVIAELDDLAQPSETLSSNSANEILDIATDIFTNQVFARKGSIQRRLQRWGYPNRKALILLHNPTSDATVESYRSLGQSARDNGIEIIPVSLDTLSSLSAENTEKLAVLAEATERLELFDPFILDSEMPTYYIPVYLQRSAVLNKYQPAPPKEVEVRLELSDCQKNPCCCHKYQKRS